MHEREAQETLMPHEYLIALFDYRAAFLSFIFAAFLPNSHLTPPIVTPLLFLSDSSASLMVDSRRSAADW